jgi:hypothetical protein
MQLFRIINLNQNQFFLKLETYLKKVVNMIIVHYQTQLLIKVYVLILKKVNHNFLIFLT